MSDIHVPRTRCFHCGRRIRYRGEMEGQVANCPACEKPTRLIDLTIPEPAESKPWPLPGASVIPGAGVVVSKLTGVAAKLPGVRLRKPADDEPPEVPTVDASWLDAHRLGSRVKGAIRFANERVESGLHTLQSMVAAKPPSDLRIAVFDTETTGLPGRQHRIVEIAVVIVDRNGVVISEYETLLNPGRDVGPADLHGIAARDIVNAPTFDKIAGDVVAIFSTADVIAAHNASFDRRFLAEEFARAGYEMPAVPMLCTCSAMGRMKLAEACKEFGIELDGRAHSAMVDTRATAKLVIALAGEHPELLAEHAIEKNVWPAMPAAGQAAYTRADAQAEGDSPPAFMNSAADAADPVSPEASLEYLRAVSVAMEDRFLCDADQGRLRELVARLAISAEELRMLHRQYLSSLESYYRRDGELSEFEADDLCCVQRLLGLAGDGTQPDAGTVLPIDPVEIGIDTEDMAGKLVCFTGETRFPVRGERLSRSEMRSLVEEIGVQTQDNVTKRLDVLVVVDPCSPSGKLTKARKYETRVLAEAVFWQKVGVGSK